MTSNKGAVGESGAAGGAAVIAALLAIGRGAVPPTVGWEVSDPDCPVSLCAQARAAAQPVFLVNSVAAGGTNYAIVCRAGDGSAS